MRTHKKHPNGCCCDVPVVDLAEGLDPMEEVEATISGDEFPLATLNNHTPSIVQAPGGDGEDQWRGYGAQCKSQAGEVVVAENCGTVGRKTQPAHAPHPHCSSVVPRTPVEAGASARQASRHAHPNATMQQGRCVAPADVTVRAHRLPCRANAIAAGNLPSAHSYPASPADLSHAAREGRGSTGQQCPAAVADHQQSGTKRRTASSSSSSSTADDLCV